MLHLSSLDSCRSNWNSNLYWFPGQGCVLQILFSNLAVAYPKYWMGIREGDREERLCMGEIDNGGIKPDHCQGLSSPLTGQWHVE